MSIDITVGHYGTIDLHTPGDEGRADIPFIVLKNAPLKYYDPEKDKDDKNDKSKADVVFAWKEEWKMVGWFDVEDYDRKTDAIIEAVRDA